MKMLVFCLFIGFFTLPLIGVESVQKFESSTSINTDYFVALAHELQLMDMVIACGQVKYKQLKKSGLLGGEATESEKAILEHISDVFKERDFAYASGLIACLDQEQLRLKRTAIFSQILSVCRNILIFFNCNDANALVLLQASRRSGSVWASIMLEVDVIEREVSDSARKDTWKQFLIRFREWVLVDFYGTWHCLFAGCFRQFFDRVISVDLDSVAVSEFKPLESAFAGVRAFAGGKKKEVVKEAELTGDECYQQGLRYYSGDGVIKNEKKAIDWFLFAAQQGHVGGQSVLAQYYYRNAARVENAYIKAFYWAQKAAANEDIAAISVLSECYYWGYGTESNDENAFLYARQAALKGDIRARIIEARCYCNGRGVTQDLCKAFCLYKQLAEQGDAEAQFLLAEWYIHGTGGGVDQKQAFEWAKKSAKQGSASGQFLLGQCYLTECGTLKNHRKARKWTLKSAAQGNALAHELLLKISPESVVKEFNYNAFESDSGPAGAGGPGRPKDLKRADELYEEAYRYFTGTIRAKVGVPQDLEKAFQLAEKSASGGSAKGKWLLGHMYYYGKGGAAIDKAKAKELAAQSAALDNAFGQALLAECYYWGHGVEKNYDAAYYWAHNAAGQESSEGQCILARMYYHGVGMPCNYVEARKYAEKAAVKKNSEAQALMARICYSEDTVDSGKEALKFAKEAARRGDAMGQFMLAKLYYEERGVVKDDREAKKWAELSAKQGNAEAQALLARCYYYEKGVVQDYNKAFEWASKAAKQSNADGEYLLALCYLNGHGVKSINKKEAEKFAKRAAAQEHSEAGALLKKIKSVCSVM